MRNNGFTTYHFQISICLKISRLLTCRECVPVHNTCKALLAWQKVHFQLLTSVLCNCLHACKCVIKYVFIRITITAFISVIQVVNLSYCCMYARYAQHPQQYEPHNKLILISQVHYIPVGQSVYTFIVICILTIQGVRQLHMHYFI